MDKAITAGQRIERLASERGLPSGAALAALFGVSYETLRKWRSGETAPNRSRAAAISKLLGVEPEAFMHGASPGKDADEGGLAPQESRLIRAYRRVLNSDRARILIEVEARAREISDIASQIVGEGRPQFGGDAKSSKRDAGH